MTLTEAVPARIELPTCDRRAPGNDGHVHRCTDDEAHPSGWHPCRCGGYFTDGQTS